MTARRSMEQRRQPRVFSGIQPSGKLHIGNYIGALSLWVTDQHVHDNIFCVVDLHALTLPERVHPSTLHQKSREVAALYLACGIDPDKSAIFIQSHVHEHSELAWILNCVTPIGWLERMTQYKTKAKQAESIGTGLLAYPVLQAADILLYHTNLVPVGEDQRQHIELTRDIARRFNMLFGELFRIPEVVIRAHGARIMALDEPDVKMSKSIGEQRPGHAIGLLDPPDRIQRTIMAAVTDSGQDMRFAYASPGVRNLLTLYEALTGAQRETIETRFAGAGYGALKKALIEAVVATLQPIQTRYHDIMRDPDYLESILTKGAERVRGIAAQTMQAVRTATGIG